MKKLKSIIFIFYSSFFLILNVYSQKTEFVFDTYVLNTAKNICYINKSSKIKTTDSLNTKNKSNNIYVSINGCYGLVSASNSQYASTTVYSGSPTTHESFNSTGSFGKGLQFGATVGYFFTENIGAELNVGYLIGEKITHTETDSRGLFQEEKSSAKMLRLTPSIKIQVGKKNIKPYMRFGLVIGLAPNITISYLLNIPNAKNPLTEESDRTMSGGTSIGFSAGVGVKYKLNERIGVFGEFSLVSQAWAPKKAVFTKSIINGVDELPSLTISQKEVEYVDPYVQGISNPNEPSKSLKTYMPFSSIGINVGLQIAIGK